MKRLFACIVCIILLFSNCAIAEEKIFDPKVLENLEGYSYDKFDKSWWYCGEYMKKFSDATAVVRIETSGNKEVFDGVLIAAYIRDEKNKEIYDVVEKLLILADDTLITCVLLDADVASGTYILPESKEVLNIIAQANELSFRLDISTGRLTLEPSAIEVKNFKTAAKILYDNNAVNNSTYSDEFIKTVRENWPITIE